MDDEAESSRAPRRHDDSAPSLAALEALEDAIARLDAAEEREREKQVQQRRMDAKRKRIQMLGELLRDLDMVVYLELITLYHLDCSFFWLAFKAFIHGTLLTPIPDTVTVTRPPDEPKPFLPLLLFSFGVNFLLHLTYPAPAAGEDTRGYLHGGLMIDFIGQQGPTSKWKLGALDICILEDDMLLPESESGHADAMEMLSSGQCVIGEFTLLDTLVEENRNYSAYRLTRTESGMNDMPETLRRLNTLRTRFGVGRG
ncbi:hypothetical protein GGP41_010683 [Bipolaris sorokiniana]|uniref:DUF1746 domain-containing protein n=1 Tax=Cochliobolus sativus TaxID=45130 RepID=A0A8H5ZKM6_COCSA|nr:hypothetical protein GGP41_010683 [Bipolaris sorokiniana]